MPVDTNIPNTVIDVLDQIKDKRPTEAIVYGIDGDRVDIRLENSASIVRHVEVVGSVDSISTGSVVQISWRNDGRPVVILVGSGGITSTRGSTVVPDNVTIENSSFGLRVKKGGISREHLSFVLPDELVGSDSLTRAGWIVNESTGVISNTGIRILPTGEIALGSGNDIVKLSAFGSPDDPASPEDDTEYRLWIGNVLPHAAPFAVTKYGELISEKGTIGGWDITSNALVSDAGNTTLHAGARPWIGIGTDVYGGNGFWAGLDTDYVYKVSVGSSFLYDGDTLTLSDIDLKFYNGSQLTLWIQDDGDFFIGDDIDTVAGTSMRIFSNDQTWDSEAFGAGDIFIGDHSGANILWDQSTGQLLFRDGGTTGIPTELYIDTDGTLKAGGGNIILDSSGISSSTYVAGISGFSIDTAGDAEFNRITLRGSLQATVFVADEVSAVGGDLMVLDADELAVDMTALDASTLTIVGNTTFAVGDMLRIKEGTDDEWLEVTNIGSAPTYTVTRDKEAAYTANNNPTWAAGAAVVNYKQSGDGGIRLLSGASPSMSIFTHAGAPWTTITDHVLLEEDISRFGQDVSAAGTTSMAVLHIDQTYNSESLGAGDLIIGDNTAAKANVLWDKSAGTLLFRGGTTTEGYIDTTGTAVFGKSELNSLGIILYPEAQQSFEDDASIRWVSNPYQVPVETGGVASILATRWNDTAKMAATRFITGSDNIATVLDTKLAILDMVTIVGDEDEYSGAIANRSSGLKLSSYGIGTNENETFAFFHFSDFLTDSGMGPMEFKVDTLNGHAWVAMRGTNDRGAYSFGMEEVGVDEKGGFIFSSEDQIDAADEEIYRIEGYATPGHFWINPQNRDLDFRVDGDTYDSLFFIDASLDKVYYKGVEIGSSTSEWSESGGFLTQNTGTDIVQIQNHMELEELGGQPGTGEPGTGWGAIYFKTDGKVYSKNDGGVEFDLTQSGEWLQTGQFLSQTTTTNIVQVLNWMEVEELDTASLPTTGEPGTGFGAIYVKASDSILYYKDDGGTEYDLTSGGGGGGGWTDGTNVIYPTVAADDVLFGGTTVGNSDIILYGTGQATFNEQGADVDFRIEGTTGNTSTYLFFVDAGSDRVVISAGGASGPTADSPLVLLRGNKDPILMMEPFDSGQNHVKFMMKNSLGHGFDFQMVDDYFRMNYVDKGSGRGVLDNMWKVQSSSAGVGNIFFNDSKLDIDMYFKSDTYDHMIRIDAGTDTAGFGTTSAFNLAQFAPTDIAINKDSGNIDFRVYGDNGEVFRIDAGLDVVQISTWLEFAETASPPTTGFPGSGFGAIYVKTDGIIYFKNDGGTEYDLTETGGSGSVDDTPYGTAWDGETTQAPSQNAAFDKINAMDTLIDANTTVTEVEAVITAEIVDGQSIDNAIDALITAHVGVTDPHTAYFLADGSRQLDGDLTFTGTQEITTSSGDLNISAADDQDIHIFVENSPPSANGQWAHMDLGGTTGPVGAGFGFVLSISDQDYSRNVLAIEETFTVFNYESIDTDFQVQSDGNAYMLFVDGGEDRVGIGTGTPSGFFEVFEAGTGRTAGSFMVDEANDTVYVGRLSSTSADNTLFFTVRNRLDAPVFSVDLNEGVLLLTEKTGLPSTGIPVSGQGAVYAMNNGKLYFKNDGGTEYDLTVQGGSAEWTESGGFLSQAAGTDIVQIQNWIELEELSTAGLPTTGEPGTGFGAVYVKASDGILYFKNDGGTEYDLTQAGTAAIDDTPYGTAWDGETTQAPSQNAAFDKIDSMDTLIDANTTATEVEAIITAEIVDGQSIDNAIDALITAHVSVSDPHTGYFLLAGETTDAKLYSSADLILYTDAGSTKAITLDAGASTIYWGVGSGDTENYINATTWLKSAVGPSAGYVYLQSGSFSFLSGSKGSEVERFKSDATAFDVTGNITVSGLVDTVDIAAFKTAYDSHSHSGSGQWIDDTGGFLYPEEVADHVIIGNDAIATADIYLGADGAAVFNEQAGSVDFRIEGNAESNLFKVAGVSNVVMIGASAVPYNEVRLHIQDDRTWDTGIDAWAEMSLGDTTEAQGLTFLASLAMPAAGYSILSTNMRFDADITSWEGPLDAAFYGADFQSVVSSSAAEFHFYGYMNDTGSTSISLAHIATDEITFNVGMNDIDFVVSGDTDQYLFNIDAGLDIINMNDTTFHTYFDMEDVTVPGTPGSGYGRVHMNSDDIFFIDDSGTSTSLTGGGAGGADVLEVQVFS